MARALLVIDIQRDYFPGGAYPLVGPEAAADNASRVLTAFRAGDESIIHVQHIAEEPDAPFLRAGTRGTEIHELVTPASGELVLQKSEPNSFLGTGLEAELRRRRVDQLIVAGMMSSMCVDATVRAAADLGFDLVVAHDACAAPTLDFAGERIPGATVHAAFMAALGDGYAKLVPVAEIS